MPTLRPVPISARGHTVSEWQIHARIASRRRWEPWEVAVLRGGYPDISKIAAELPGRTPAAIKGKAAYLRIRGRAAPRWSDTEIMRLRKVYPTGSREDVEAAFPGRSFDAIAGKARTRGIRRAKRHEGPTDNRLLDQIFKEASRQNLSRADLDYLSRSGRYFQRAKWKVRPNTAIHCRAAIAMGATIRAGFGS